MKTHNRVKIGQKFNKLTATGYSHVGKNGQRYLEFRCKCGNKVVRSACRVRSGKVRSCGCLRREITIKQFGLFPGQAAIRAVMNDYRQSSKRRNLVFKLTEKFFRHTTQKDCFYCGQKPSTVRKLKSDTGEFVHNGLDRVDSSKGYVENNVVPCCPVCNRAKGDMKQKDFYEWIQRAHNGTSRK